MNMGAKLNKRPIDAISCLIMKDGEGMDVLATLVPRIDGKGYWLEFPVEPPFDLLMVNGIRVDVKPLQ